MATSHSNQLAGDVGVSIPGDRNKGKSRLHKILPYAGAAMLAGAVAYTQFGGYNDRIHTNQTTAITNDSIKRPKASGYETDEKDYIIPDFKLNSSYDFSDINDFVLALVEAEKARHKEFLKKELLFPGVPEYSVGELFSCRKYRISGIRKASEKEVKNAPDGIDGLDLYEVTMGSEIPYEGSSIKMVRLIVGKRNNRFWLIEEK